MQVESNGKPKDVRHRSLPSSKPYMIAVFFYIICFLAILATSTAFVMAFVHPSQLAVRLIEGGLILSGITWFIAFYKRRSAVCPLCRCSPLLNSGAIVHSKATRIYPLNHGLTAILSMIVLQRFRCMYCGSNFDLLKTPSQQLDPKKNTSYSDTILRSP